MPDALHFTGNDEADRLLASDPMALLIGFALDQQVPVPTAFSGPENAVGTGTCWSSANPIRSASGSCAISTSASSFPVKWSRSGTP